MVNLLDPESTIKSIHIAAGLGASSAHTWLKLPVVDDLARVMDATTLPTLLLGGGPAGRPAGHLRPLGECSRAACCPRARRRPGPAVPARRRCGRRGRHRSRAGSRRCPMCDNERWVRPRSAPPRPTAGRSPSTSTRRGDGWQHTSLFTGRLAEARGGRSPPGVGARRRAALGLAHGGVRAGEGDAGGPGSRCSRGPTRRGLRGPRQQLHRDRSGGPAHVAVCPAPGSRPPGAGVPPRRRGDVPVELRGAGTASREVRNFGTPGVLEVTRSSPARSSRRPGLELLPPAQARRGPRGRRERARRRSTTSRCRSSRPWCAPPRGRTRSATSGSTRTTSARSTCSPRCARRRRARAPRWHGPAMAAPGYDLYYLNVDGRPGRRGGLADLRRPGLGWVRETWTSQDVDPRLPLGGTR